MCLRVQIILSRITINCCRPEKYLPPIHSSAPQDSYFDCNAVVYSPLEETLEFCEVKTNMIMCIVLFGQMNLSPLDTKHYTFWMLYWKSLTCYFYSMLADIRAISPHNPDSKEQRKQKFVKRLKYHATNAPLWLPRNASRSLFAWSCCFPWQTSTATYSCKWKFNPIYQFIKLHPHYSDGKTKSMTGWRKVYLI